MTTQERRLTLFQANAGNRISNKFLAKIASDWRMPNGLFVIQPHEAYEFLHNLPIGRIPGVGKVTEQNLISEGIKTVGQIQGIELGTLEARFGRYGLRLYELAHGIDHSPVVSNRVAKSISAEDTFPVDLPLAETEPTLRKLAGKVWAASRENARGARTVVLKLKTKKFKTLTRSITPPKMPTSAGELANLAASLFTRVEASPINSFGLWASGLAIFKTWASLRSSPQQRSRMPLKSAQRRSCDERISWP